MRVLLAELGHPKPPDGTPVFTDNRTAKGILASLCRQRLSKAFDMRCYWIKDRIKQKQFKITWRPGVDNMADYFSKHHPPWYHKTMRYKYLHKPRDAHEDEDTHKVKVTIHIKSNETHSWTCAHIHARMTIRIQPFETHSWMHMQINQPQMTHGSVRGCVTTT